MKKTIITFLCLIFVFFANTVFAGDGIPGISVGAGRNPGGIMISQTTTDKEGKFTFTLEKGKYDITLLSSYDEIIKVISGIDKNYESNKNGYDITLVLSGDIKGVTVNDKKVPVSINITKETGAITVNSTAKKVILSGLLTYQSKDEEQNIK